MANKRLPLEPDLPNIRSQARRAGPLRRMFGWGSAATVALAALALTTQTEAGGKRLQIALAYIGEPVRAVAQIPRANENEAETQRLAAQLRDLAADRERLTARIATLERNLEDVTGSIKQRADKADAPATPPPVATADSPPPMPSAPAVEAAEQAASPASLPALKPLRPPPVSEAASADPPPPADPKIADAAPRQAPELAQPLPEPIPLPPVRVAAVANETAATPSPTRPEFAIDLGGGVTVEALRIHWAAIKASYGPLLTGLHPVVAARSRHPSGVDYHLLAGPLPTAAAAAQLCTHLPPTRTSCRPARFSGAHLAEH